MITYKVFPGSMQHFKKAIFLTSALILFVGFIPPGDFLTEQKKFQRVKTSFSEKGKVIEQKLRERNINLNELNILIVAYKSEKELDLYVKKKSEIIYKKLTTYDICSSSGTLGPKRKVGDYQVPEGFYHIDRFNPTSQFYLSLGINYPNKSDRIKSTAKNPGGDIFIHGSCVTIGCMPLTDEKIKEVYLYAIHARQNGETKIPVYIFPFKMTDQNFNTYKTSYKSDPKLIGFWSNLKTGYDTFEKEQAALNYSIDAEGNYTY